MTVTAHRDATDAAVFFSAFVREHLDSIYSSAYRFTRSHADAEDLVQETLYRAWAHLDRSRTAEETRAWVYRIMVNLAKDGWRRRAVVRVDSVEPDRFPDGDARMPAAGLSTLRNLTSAEVRAAIDSLPPHHRLSVMLVDIDGFSYAEAAAVVGIAVGTLTSRLRRGRAALRRTLWHSAATAGLQSDLVCREAGALVAAYCRGETSPAESEFVAAHLGRCLKCRDVVEIERELLSLVRERACAVAAPDRLYRLNALLYSRNS